jgi:hypothetical protein
VHFVAFPIAHVFTTVAPRVGSFTVDVIVVELAHIAGLILPPKHAEAFFLSSNVLALIDSTIGPSLGSLPVLLIFEPIALVSRAIHVHVHTFALGFVIEPLSFVDVTICMN